jgi:chaperonin cofactor prefoldin
MIAFPNSPLLPRSHREYGLEPCGFLFSSSQDAEVVEQLRKQLATTEQRLQFAELKIQVLEERLRRKLIEKYGPGQRRSGKRS